MTWVVLIRLISTALVLKNPGLCSSIQRDSYGEINSDLLKEKSNSLWKQDLRPGNANAIYSKPDAPFLASSWLSQKSGRPPRRPSQPVTFDLPSLASSSATSYTSVLPSTSSRLPFTYFSSLTTNAATKDITIEEKCSSTQLENSSKKQKFYINNYLSPRNNISRENITIGFLSSFKYNKLALGALPIAVEAVNSNPTLLPGRRLLFEVADVGNSNLEELAPLSIRRMTAMRDKGHLAFIGPDDNCANEALVAAAWNLPMITYKCADQRVSNKTRYYTVARTMPPSTKIVKALISIMKEYHWTQFVLLTENTRNYIQIKEAVKSFAKHHRMNITEEYSVPYDYTTTRYHTVQDFVRDSLHHTRIYVLVASFEVQWDFVVALREEVGQQLQEYAIVTIDDDKYLGADQLQEMRVPGKEFLTMYKEVPDLYEGFRAVLKITPAYPSNTKYKEFEQRVLNRIKQHPFCVPYNPSIFKYIEVPVFAAHLYDAVMIYAKALNQTLADANADPANGTHIISLIKNQAFPSIQGFNVHMDENGDAEGSYSLLAIRKLGPEHNPPMGWRKVGQFILEAKTSGIHDMDNLPRLALNETIEWLGGSPPRDAPPCGFSSEKCHYDWHSVAVGLVISMIFLVAGLFLFRHYSYEHKLACLLWKIDMREVNLINTELRTFDHGNTNTIQVCRQSVFAAGSGDCPSDEPRYAYCKIGLYKGNIVAIKPIKKRTVDLTRSIRKELKQMRDVRHENLLAFIGCSVDTGNVCVLTAYCARGSLHDVLSNDDLLLDNMFVASLVADLIKGMIYLHDSEIVSHGNLRSTNCLIDSRWILQVADFGLHEFKASPYQMVEPHKKLWRAPELLRAPGAHPRGTQKGDVFSFGIILFEVVGRQGPWGALTHKFSLQEIVCQVAEGQEPPLRPPLGSLKTPEYVQRCLMECWAEDPDERPDFKLVRVRLKEMQSGLKLNIVDNMLAMMEKYAYNLEGKVQERTKQLMEEKKKTETLLLRMLPKSVAESLKRGEQVSPESYDNVTIYFSDIVGFTSLSAESAPLQMVNMLNELYTCFDAIISDYDIYKVETIGDAYMVVSGLPISNGDQHAGEIASMALKLLSAVKQFTIRHRPWDTLKLRIGIHSGPCVAGVVGLTMPRYCLFGDTVNTASRMESTGEELRIHSSHAHKLMLDKLGGYIVQERGLTYVKGKGHMMTWWLVGEQQPRVRRSACRPESTLTTTGGASTSPLTPHPSPHSPHLSPHPHLQPAPTTPLPHYPTIVIGLPVSAHDPETHIPATQSGSCGTTQSCAGSQTINPSGSATSDVNNPSSDVASDVNKQRDAEINDILSPDQTDSPLNTTNNLFNNGFNSALQDPRTIAGPSSTPASISCRSPSPRAPHRQVRASRREPLGASVDYNSSTSQQNSPFNPSSSTNPGAAPPVNCSQSPVNNIYNPVCNQNPVVASIYNSYSPKTAHSPPSSAITTGHNPHLINTTAHNILLSHNPETTSERRLQLTGSPRLNSCGSERNSRRSKNYRSSNRNSVYNSVYSSSSSSSSDSIIPYVTTGEQQRILPVNASPNLAEHDCNLFSTSFDCEESAGVEGTRGYDIVGRDVPHASHTHQEELQERPGQLHLDPSTVSYNIKPPLVSGGGLGLGSEDFAGGEIGGQGTTQESITTLPDLRSGLSHHHAAYSSSPGLSRKQETRENFV